MERFYLRTNGSKRQTVREQFISKQKNFKINLDNTEDSILKTKVEISSALEQMTKENYGNF